MARIIKIFVSSPGDVKAERAVLNDVVGSIKSPLINSINHTKFRSTHIRRFDFEK